MTGPVMATGRVESPHVATRVCVLAGGQGRRLGGEKSRVLLAGEPLLAHVLRAARATGLPVSVIRRDENPGRGPLGGMVTAMNRFRADAIVFLACDMPFINAPLIERLLDRAHITSKALTCFADERAGFPLLLRRTDLADLRDVLENGPASLRGLFARINPERLSPPYDDIWRLHNINRPEDLEEAERLLVKNARR